MPFQYNIDTNFEQVDVSVEVFNNTITFYFDGASYTIAESHRDIWELVHHQFIDDLDQYNPAPVEGTDSVHLKKAHVHPNDVERCHIHIEYMRPINPSILSEYFNTFLKHDRFAEINDRLLPVEETFESLLNQYSVFYNDAISQRLEKKLIAQQQFTPEEGRDYLASLFESPASPKPHVILDAVDYREQLSYLHNQLKKKVSFFNHDNSKDSERFIPDSKRLKKFTP